MRDPLDLFNDGFDIKSRRQKAIEDDKEYPGNTPPKNRGSNVDTATHAWLNDLPSYEYLVGSVAKKFYTIGSLAKALGRTPVTVRSWEAKGWLPSASFRTPPPKGEQVPGKQVKGRRLYSEAQIVFLVEAAITFNIDDPHNPNWKGFRKHIADNYPRH